MNNCNMIDMVSDLAGKVIKEREKVISRCVVDYAYHLGVPVGNLVVTHRLDNYPAVTKFVSDEGEVIFEVYDPEFDIKHIGYGSQKICSSFKHREFWKDE